jgi:hypothetical protein
VTAQELGAIRVLALHRVIHDFLANSAQEIFVEVVDGRTAQTEDVESIPLAQLVLILLRVKHVVAYKLLKI